MGRNRNNRRQRMNIDFETLIKKQMARIVDEKIEKMIREKVNQFNRELLSKKENYIAELMKSIRIYSEQQTIDNIPRYLITIENTYKIES